MKKEAKEAHQKNDERKREKGQGYHLLFHTCASKEHHDLHDREFPMLSLSYTSGNFHYRTWLVYSYNGSPQVP